MACEAAGGPATSGKYRLISQNFPKNTEDMSYFSQPPSLWRPDPGLSPVTHPPTV